MRTNVKRPVAGQYLNRRLHRLATAVASILAVIGLLALVPGAGAATATGKVVTPFTSASLPSNCSLAGSTVTCTFSYTGSEQTWVVPPGVTSAHVDAVGGTGGNNAESDGIGGYGGTISSDLATTPGSTLYIEVGGNGSTGAGGLSGGQASGGSGGSYFDSLGFSTDGGGGGGASAVQTCSASDPSCTGAYDGASDPRLVVAGGGGGGGGYDGCQGGSGGGGTGSEPSGPGCIDGGGGGDGSGGSGAELSCSSYTFTNGGGGGATPSAVGGAGNSDTGLPGQAGSGPSGGNGYAGGSASSGGGGGGGGGYYGGGGGGATTDCGQYGFGGGAGSSFSAGTNVTYGNDTTGSPSVTISYGFQKVSPTLSASAPSNGTAGSAIPSSSISAQLSGSAPNSGGTITFTVYGPQSSAPTDCSSGGTTVGTATVSGDGTYNPSAGYTPTAAGDYWWYASYSGDSNDNSAASTCGSQMAETQVAQASPSLSASAPSSDGVDQAISSSSISASLSGSAPNSGGTITFTVYGPQSSAPTDCSSGGTTVGTATVSGDGTYNPSAGYTPTAAGDYWWYASYSGDSNDNSAASTCGSQMAETQVAQASPSLNASGPASGTAGQSISPSSISASLSGSSSNSTGTITFVVFGPQSTAPTGCSSGGTTVGTATVSGDGTYNPSSGFTPPSAGDYWWYATYSGDSNNNSADSPCGASMSETVVSAAPPVQQAPTATTKPSSDVKETCAKLNGIVNPNGASTTYYFEYGTTMAYGSKTKVASAGSGSSAESESATVCGLKPGTTYHFRITAGNSAGTTHGADKTFRTALPHLKLRFYPRSVQAGARTCFVFHVTDGKHGVGKVRIRLAGQTAYSSPKGAARLCATLKAGTWRATASKHGYRSTVLSVRAMAPPSFTG